jgi:S1-C subfamily serine protease
VADKSPAARAGLKSGDVLVKVAGFRVNNRFDVERAFWNYKEGDKVEAAVLREGRETFVALTVTGGTGEHVASFGTKTGTAGTADQVQAASDR